MYNLTITHNLLYKTKAIAPVHYAGMGRDMDAIMDLAGAHDFD